MLLAPHPPPLKLLLCAPLPRLGELATTTPRPPGGTVEYNSSLAPPEASRRPVPLPLNASGHAGGKTKAVFKSGYN